MVTAVLIAMSPYLKRMISSENPTPLPPEITSKPNEEPKPVKVAPEEFNAVADVLKMMEHKLLFRDRFSEEIDQYVGNPTELRWASILSTSAQIANLDDRVQVFEDRLPKSFYITDRISYRNLIGVLEDKKKVISRIREMKHPVCGEQLDELRTLSRKIRDLKKRIEGLGDELERYGRSIKPKDEDTRDSN